MPDDLADRLDARVADDDLRARLTALEAREQARLLLNAYATGCDVRDPAAVAATFADDGVLEAGANRFDGRAAIETFYVRGLDRERRHFVTNVSLTHGGGGTLVASSYLFVLEPGSPVGVRWGRYDDRIVVDAAGVAHFAHRRITIEGNATMGDSGR